MSYYQSLYDSPPESWATDVTSCVSYCKSLDNCERKLVPYDGVPLSGTDTVRVALDKFGAFTESLDVLERADFLQVSER